MNLLVTGGAGRLGREVVRLAAEKGYRPVAFDLPQVRWEVFEGSDVGVFKGDVTDAGDVEEAVRGVDAVVHLAAILPPRSEADRDLTMRVNLGGTGNLLEALRRQSEVPLVFASTVSAYGVTAHEEPPVGESRPLRAHDLYSESKIRAEQLIAASGVPHSVLRIAPISVPEIVELPETIPYRADQRVEFINVEDAARAIVNAVGEPGALGRAFNVAGGASWQMTGAGYVEAFYGALGIEVEPRFSEEYTGVDWYDTSAGQFLGYQRLTFNGLLGQLEALAVELGLG
ncbi:MAG: NAD(P)-dependent oxidoreductase [Candidatus Bathyarchaeota archaeon]|nr:MAG: NAD(P)-dependent oxidoreductase [Candidatus Bathyarchaeota archaeon]